MIDEPTSIDVWIFKLHILGIELKVEFDSCVDF